MRRWWAALFSRKASAASQLRNLRRFEEAGVTHCFLRSPRDERETEIERRYDGKRLTISQARKLVAKHADEIKRSVFTAEVQF